MKSYKREVAVYLILLWTVLVAKVFFSENSTELAAILKDITPYILVPSLAVFGLHSYLNKDK